MNNNNDGIFERWQIDAEILNSITQVKTKQPQCFQCKYRAAGNLMHCEKYDSLIDRWGMDVDSYESGVSSGRRKAFCKECIYFQTENALKCEKYINNEKPSEVLHSKRECE